MANGKLEGIEKEMHDRALAEAKSSNITLPLSGVAIQMKQSANGNGDSGTKVVCIRYQLILQSPIDFLISAPLAC
jgi:hypothetical protein